VLHVACHGRADLDAPALSHLALSRPRKNEQKVERLKSEDGIVTLRELRDLALTAELCVLSACETGAGKLRPFEGLSGLSRAVLAAGAQSVVSTLWEVQDQAARTLMAAFYREWLEGQATKAEALARAKRDAIAAGIPLRTWSAYLLWDAGR
jgi:CHAT domain-containing protein